MDTITSNDIWFSTNNAVDEIDQLFHQSCVYRKYDVQLRSVKKEYGSLFFCTVKHENNGSTVFRLAFKVNSEHKIKILVNICRGIVNSLK